jgi:hypothetical protein
MPENEPDSRCQPKGARQWKLIVRRYCKKHEKEVKGLTAQYRTCSNLTNQSYRDNSRPRQWRKESHSISRAAPGVISEWLPVSKPTSWCIFHASALKKQPSCRRTSQMIKRAEYWIDPLLRSSHLNIATVTADRCGAGLQLELLYEGNQWY